MSQAKWSFSSGDPSLSPISRLSAFFTSIIHHQFRHSSFFFNFLLVQLMLKYSSWLIKSSMALPQHILKSLPTPLESLCWFPWEDLHLTIYMTLPMDPPNVWGRLTLTLLYVWLLLHCLPGWTIEEACPLGALRALELHWPDNFPSPLIESFLNL